MDLVTETFHFPGEIKSLFVFSFRRARDKKKKGNAPTFPNEMYLKEQSIYGIDTSIDGVSE